MTKRQKMKEQVDLIKGFASVLKGSALDESEKGLIEIAMADYSYAHHNELEKNQSDNIKVLMEKLEKAKQK